MGDGSVESKVKVRVIVCLVVNGARLSKRVQVSVAVTVVKVAAFLSTWFRTT